MPFLCPTVARFVDAVQASVEKPTPSGLVVWMDAAIKGFRRLMTGARQDREPRVLRVGSICEGQLTLVKGAATRGLKDPNMIASQAETHFQV